MGYLAVARGKGLRDFYWSGNMDKSILLERSKLAKNQKWMDDLENCLNLMEYENVKLYMPCYLRLDM